jgi:hypothetical protein
MLWLFICFGGGLAKYVLVSVSLWCPCVLMSVHVTSVCVERGPITDVAYCKDYVCIRFDHHTGVIEWCVGVFDCLFVVPQLLYHCGCDIEEVEVVESLNDSFQFDVMGCRVRTYSSS